jgi:hypothetical protein
MAGAVLSKGGTFGADVILSCTALRDKRSVKAITYLEVATVSGEELWRVSEEPRFSEVHRHLRHCALILAVYRCMVICALYIRLVRLNSKVGSNPCGATRTVLDISNGVAGENESLASAEDSAPFVCDSLRADSLEEPSSTSQRVTLKGHANAQSQEDVDALMRSTTRSQEDVDALMRSTTRSQEDVDALMRSTTRSQEDVDALMRSSGGVNGLLRVGSKSKQIRKADLRLQYTLLMARLFGKDGFLAGKASTPLLERLFKDGDLLRERPSEALKVVHALVGVREPWQEVRQPASIRRPLGSRLAPWPCLHYSK